MSNVSERSPLLRGSEQAHRRPWSLHPLTLAALFACIVFVTELGGSILGPAVVQLEERAICSTLYPDVDDSLSDPRCKHDDVQTELSRLLGWEAAFSMIPGIFLSVPYGIMSEKHGRRIVMALAQFGVGLTIVSDLIICAFPETFPIRLVWFVALFTIIGGGPSVYIAMAFTIANDLATDRQRANLFFYLIAVKKLGAFVGAPLALLVLNHQGAWVAAWLGCVVYAVAMVSIMALPETKYYVNRKPDDNDEDNESPHFSTPHPGVQSLREGFKTVWALCLENKKIGLLLLSILFTTYGTHINQILKQFARKRFGWTWAQSYMLDSVIALTEIVLVAIILPVATHLMVRRLNLSTLQKDSWLAHMSIVTLLVGSLTVGLAQSAPALLVGVTLLSLGSGFPAAIRSVLAGLTGKERAALLFSSFSLLENMATVGSSPLMAASFQWGIRLGTFWNGMAFLVSGALLSCAALIVFSVAVGADEVDT